MPNEPIEINLTGSFYEMGEQYVTQLKETLINQLLLSRQSFHPNNPELKPTFEALKEQLLSIAEKTYPPEIIEFFNGALNSHFAKNNGLKLKDFIELDNAYLISIMALRLDIKSENSPKTPSRENCSFIGFSYKNGTIGGRNFDLSKEALYCINNNPIILTMKNTNTIKYPNKILSIGMPGTICNPTIINDKNLFFSVNSAGNCTDLNIDLSRMNMGQLTLKMMQYESFESLEAYLVDNPAFMGFNINIAGGNPHELRSIEMSPFNKQHNINPDIPNFKNRSRSAESNNTLYPDWDVNANMLVSTNLFRLADWDPILGHPIPTDKGEPEFGFSTERYQNLIKLGRLSIDNIFITPSCELIKRIMERGLNNNDMPTGATKYVPTTDETHDSGQATYYTTAFKTYQNKQKKPKLTVRFQQQEVTDGPGKFTEWKKYRLN